MFTGIVRDVGHVVSVDKRSSDLHVSIKTSLNLSTAEVGASISCSGCCLTIVDKSQDTFSVDISSETLARTRSGLWQTGSLVNLEPSLKLGDELGGHLVSGHVDGLARVVSISPEGGSHRLIFETEQKLMPFLAEKGSVTLDGVSLTVNRVEGAQFHVNIIPHTWGVTTLGRLQAGDAVNIEVDMLARYVARMLSIKD